MMAYSHAPSGAAAWLPVGVALGVPTLPNLGLAVVAGVAALLPDMDHPSSVLPRSFPGGRFLARRIATATGGHRHGTHTFVAAIAATAMAWWTAYVMTPLSATHSLTLAGAIGVGYLAHILGDCLTLSGVPVLLPFSSRDFGLRLFRTGGGIENLLVAPVLGLAVVWEVWVLIDPTVSPYVAMLHEVFGT